MGEQQRWKIMAAACMTAMALASCGGDANNDKDEPAPAPVPEQPSGPPAPALTGSVAVDGRNWINYRREQAGVPTVTQNNRIDIAAQAHSEWQRRNNTVSHTETPGTPGFTGETMRERLDTAGYTFTGNYAYGEVIAATTNQTGANMVDELITAIFHRFVIFEPVFKELGTGAATSSSNYTYFTANFASNNGYGPGTASIVTWPFSGQTGVTRVFASDSEAPDPIPNLNEVGYPISVHANITSVLTVETFTVRPRGGAPLAVTLLSKATDARPETPTSAAAIIPMQVLAARTTYDVIFSGALNGMPVTRAWSFTTN